MKDPIKSAMRSSSEGLKWLYDMTSVLPRLSPRERVLVEYILQHPAQIPNLSASELAEASGVSEATIFRLCRHLKFGGYTPLRDAIERSVAQYGEDFVSPISVDFDQDPNMGPMLSGVYVSMRAILDAATLGEEQIERASQAIASAGRLIVCGMGAVSGRIVELAAYGFQRMGLTAMTWIDSQVANAASELFHSGDVLLAVSHSGANPELMRFVEMAGKTGVKTIAITNYGGSPLADRVDIPLVTSTREVKAQNLALMPRVSQLVVVQVLINRVAALRGRTLRHGMNF